MPEFEMDSPRAGDHVSSHRHEGVFEIVEINASMQTANIRAVDGSGPVLTDVPWEVLRAADKK
jgi:hypothetical protein